MAVDVRWSRLLLPLLAHLFSVSSGFVKLRMDESNIINGNVDGPRSIRFRGITEVNGQSVDMLLSETGRDVNREENEGRLLDIFTKWGIAGVKVDSGWDVTIEVRFIYTGTYMAATLNDSFPLTFFGLESGEQVEIQGFEDYCTESTAGVKVEKTAYKGEPDGYLTNKASRFSGKLPRSEENPEPNLDYIDQRTLNRLVTIIFPACHKISFNIKLTGSPTQAVGHRTFFAFYNLCNYTASSITGRNGASSITGRNGASSITGRNGPTVSRNDMLLGDDMQKECKGFEKQWGRCADLPPCDSCVPRDCEFAEWADWYDAGGCSGLCYRHRNVKISNNECGDPCKGSKVQSKRCPAPGCQPKRVDCEWSPWGKWTPCASALSQRIRSRKILQQPQAGGRACEGPVNQTETCKKNSEQVDCKFSDWGSWTKCSATCGTGWRSATRRVVQKAANGGIVCDGTTTKTKECSEKPCEKRDCKFSAWSSWEGCDEHSNLKNRKRDVSVAPLGMGNPCAGSLKQVEMCPERKKDHTCELGTWSRWTVCDKKCDGGQRKRTRLLTNKPKDGGACPTGPLSEVEACNTEPCKTEKDDCTFTDWADWSTCSVTCGSGETYRTRKVQTPAKDAGQHCLGATHAVRPCQGGVCVQQDCTWGQWEPWSECTCTCGGGNKHRSRLIKVAPTNGGQLCDPKDKSEVTSCNSVPCDIGCIDGEWAAWSAWSPCSAKCGVGYKSRHRDISRQPNHCGEAAVGLEDDFQLCNTKIPCIPDVDCQLSDWHPWTTCSCSCIGVRERHRDIVVYASGKGQACHDDVLTEIGQCNPDPLPDECVSGPDSKTTKTQDCKLSDWADWDGCSAPCGGGAQQRVRKILSPAGVGGMPCSDVLSQVQPCNTQACKGVKCVDCKWGAWSDWGQCAKCGNQRYRHRGILRMPNSCGRVCDPAHAKEAGECHSPCEDDVFCAWTQWTATTKCSADCGRATRMRERQLTLFTTQKELRKETGAKAFLVKGQDNMRCYGLQAELSTCDLPKCKSDKAAVDCLFGDWKEWTTPICSLCERRRSIKRQSTEGGSPCDGPLVQTKFCEDDCTKQQDCVLSDWSSWTPCSGGATDKSRSRRIIQHPLNGGLACTGALKEIGFCASPGPKKTPCKFGLWEAWGECSATCGKGLRERTRIIAKGANYGGEACVGRTRESEQCLVTQCVVPDDACVMSPWSKWSDMSISGQLTRKRQIVTEARGTGKPCSDSLKEIKGVNLKRDCVVSEWAKWDPCDKTCGGGQTSRFRQVTQNPQGGGEACPTSLQETRGCGTKPCESIDCLVKDWSLWGPCSATCGSGQQMRERLVSRLAEDGGSGCSMDLNDIRPCPKLPPCKFIDCSWAKWSDWSDCTCDCDGGQRSRSRRIAKMPEPGGKLCDPKSSEEIEPCNTQPCSENPCVDGKWAPWSDWEDCSQTCEGGLTWRQRTIAKEANNCGSQPVGPQRIVMSCNNGVSCAKDVDCKFSDWEDWSVCTKACDGIQKRNRRIVVFRRGNGQYCKGALQETVPCNPRDGESSPAECKEANPVDCQLGGWGKWSPCTATCGGGQQHSVRDIIQHATGGGTGCKGKLAKTRPCAEKSCTTLCARQDCKWGDWSMWSVCDRCGGQRGRVRSVVQHAKCGGKACDPGLAEELTNCTRRCHEPAFCAWREWDEWSSCTATCGHGQRSRLRELTIVDTSDVRFLQDLDVRSIEERFDMLKLKAASVEARQHQEIFIAFVAGLITLSMAAAVGRRIHSAATPEARARAVAPSDA